VPAIGDFLSTGADVDFTSKKGGDLVGHRTLRQAVIDALGAIGGDQAAAVSLAQVQRATEPMEIVLLARILDTEEPGLHGQAVLDAVGDALQLAAHASIEESPDVSPLFDLLRADRGEQAVALLERSVPEWEEYALIALAGLPDGAGVPSMIAVAARADAAANRALPFQALAQTAARYPEAGEALVELAGSARIPDGDWRALGEALEGKQLQFSADMFAGTPLADAPPSSARSPLKSYFIEWLNVRYEQRLASADWSDDQLERQLALIDRLHAATTSPAATRALDQARATLERARRPDEPSTPQG
jgi:hypothetical protein